MRPSAAAMPPPKGPTSLSSSGPTAACKEGQEGEGGDSEGGGFGSGGWDSDGILSAGGGGDGPKGGVEGVAVVIDHVDAGEGEGILEGGGVGEICAVDILVCIEDDFGLEGDVDILGQ